MTYTIAAHDRIKWKDKRHQITQWVEWEYTAEEKEKALKRGLKLPKIELGRMYWAPGWSNSLRIPVIVKKTWKEGKKKEKFKEQTRLPFDNGDGGYWEYYAVVTNHNLFETNYQEIFKYYQKR